jgi:16S rRNA (guanine966-N2)-methyltransferase
MRIVGGALRGRRLAARPSPATRPTSDRVREGVASALEARDAFTGAHVLDLFAGTGALGFEALSRGAAAVVAIDCERTAVRCIKENAAALALEGQHQVLALDLFSAPAKIVARLAQTGVAPFTLVFADPPYSEIEHAVELLSELAKHAMIAPDAIVVVEHARGEAPAPPPYFAGVAAYRYGDTEVALWRAIAGSPKT